MQPRKSGTQSHRSALIRTLRAVGHLGGTHVIWKDVVVRNLDGLPSEFHIHSHPLCLYVKDTLGMLARCRICDDIRLRVTALRKRTPFFKTCHAGITELVIPVFDGPRYLGSFAAGPCRRHGARTPYPECAALHASLPEPDARTIRSIYRALSGVVNQTRTEKSLPFASPHDAQGHAPGLGTALAYIDREFRGPIRAADAARAANLSESRFLHLFSHELGLTFTEYLTAHRMHEARRMLVRTGESVGRIAASVGYTNQSYFCALFRREMGVSPRAFRNGHRRKD